MTEKRAINVVWLKRDLRLSDHEPLTRSIDSGLTLLFYVFEPDLLADPHYDERHWRFIWQSLEDLNKQLNAFSTRIFVYYGSAIDGFNEINKRFTIKHLFSHEETGLQLTFTRDLRVKQWCHSHDVSWYETPTGTVIRGAKNRIDWGKHWQQIMKAPLSQPALRRDALVCTQMLNVLPEFHVASSWVEENPSMLKGGELWAQRTLTSFFKGRGKSYHFNVSKPLESRRSCSRISPYLAWGNMSLRQFYQAILKQNSEHGWSRPLNALASRVHWHCHFIQKFESEHHMQWRPVNVAFEHFKYPELHSGLSVKQRLVAWQSAQTGYPLVDASMRCLQVTGYINFRMRAMLVSFLCHHLLVDWRLGVAYLAKLFLDFEPGIHYAQFQMQAGVTGVNAIRVYNPVKQSIEKDKDGEFLLKWLPELCVLPKELIHTPWELSAMEEMLYRFKLGETYPKPIIDISETGKIARDLLWGFLDRLDTKNENKRILVKHVRQPTKKRALKKRKE